MKHPATRELYHYWNRRRGLRATPERSEVEPFHLKGILPDTFVLSIDANAGHPFRIAGTRICALFGRELKRRSFVGLWDEGLQVLDLLEAVAADRTGLVAGAHATIDGVRTDLEVLVLPLTQGGTRPTRFIGTLAPFGSPNWLRAQPASRLTLGMHRHVGGAVEHLGPRLISGAQAGHAHEGLRVLEGGRA
jgi:hypothetical protein